MPPFPDFDLVNQPDPAAARERLNANVSPEADMLVLYQDNYDFLERVLQAAGYDDPQTQLHLLPWSPADGPLTLTTLQRQLGVTRTLLFGQDLPALGLHFQVIDFFPVTLAGVTYLTCPSVASIADAKAGGNNGPAGALWRAVKGHFLREC